MASAPGLSFAMFTLDFKNLFEIMAAAIMQAFLGIKAPEMASALLTGSAGMTMGSVTGTVMQAMNFAGMTRMAGGGVGGGAAAAAKHSGGNLRDAVGAGHGAPGAHRQPAPDRSDAVASLNGLGGRTGGQAGGREAGTTGGHSALDRNLSAPVPPARSTPPGASPSQGSQSSQTSPAPLTDSTD